MLFLSVVHPQKKEEMNGLAHDVIISIALVTPVATGLGICVVTDSVTKSVTRRGQMAVVGFVTMVGMYVCLFTCGQNIIFP